MYRGCTCGGRKVRLYTPQTPGKAFRYTCSMPGVQEILSSVCGGLVKLARHTGEQQRLRACTSICKGLYSLWVCRGLCLCCLDDAAAPLSAPALCACPSYWSALVCSRRPWHLCKGLCKALRLMPVHHPPPLGPAPPEHHLPHLAWSPLELPRRQGGLDRGHLFPHPGGASDH